MENIIRERIGRRLTHLRSVRDSVVIDGDVHPSDPKAYPGAIAERITVEPGYFHGRPLSGEQVLAALDRGGVDMALCWQNPAVLPYGEDQAQNAAALRRANDYVAALAEKHPNRVIPAGWTDPKALGLDRAIALARACVLELGMPVVKMNPAQNAFPIDDPMVVAVVDAIVDLGAVPAFHFGADTPYTPPSGLETLAARHPEHPIIGVHMGGGGGHFVEAEPVYQEARALGLRRPNVFYIFSAQRDVHIRAAIIAYLDAGPPFSRNIAAGSDAPYGDIEWNFGGFGAMLSSLSRGEAHDDPRLQARPRLVDEDAIRGIMGRNLADLVIAADERLLARHGAPAR